MSANNIYIGNSDPLLGSRDFTTQYRELERMEQNLAERRKMLMQMREQVEPQQSQTPVWDEIESVIQGMSDKEFDLVVSNEEYAESQNRINALVQEMQLRIIKPLVEQSKEGRDALDNHLTLVKRLRKSASKEVDSELALFNEYRENYSDVPYDEFLKMKREPQKSKK